MSGRTILLGVWGVLGLAMPARGWEVALDVRNEARSGVPPFVSGGVPLLAGQARDTGELRLAYRDADGRLVAIPAQFRVLARWWRGDNSIRWVLVDFATADVPSERITYASSGTPPKGRTVFLTNAALDSPAAKPAVTVDEQADAITVSTGAATFTIDKKRFSLLKSAVVDGVELLEGSADHGLVIEDTYGERYYGSEGTRAVTVLERGPVRVCVRAQGGNQARDGKGYSRGMYGYDVFMHFYAGSPEIGVDVVLTNHAAKSIGSPTFEDASLVLKLAGRATGCRVYGAAPLDARLAAGESVCLYQDSNGAETWRQCLGGQNAKTVSFRGYRILKRADGTEEVLAAGDHARGLMHLYNDQGGAVLLMRNFWQQFPKAVEAAGDGTLRLGMFPRECAAPHYLEDGAGKGHELLLHFYAKGKSRFASDESGRTWPHVFANAWDPPAFPRPTLAHQAACGALVELGPYTVPTTGLDEYDAVNNLARLMMTDRYKGNGLGWQVFGERWDSYGGHSTRGARQPIKEDCFLFRWFLTGDAGWLDVGINRSRHYRDVRRYRIDDQDALAFKSWAEFKTANLREDGWCSRPVPADDELKKHQQGFLPRMPWDLPNTEHTTLDLLYDRYLLFGDQRAYENMRIVAGHGAFYAIAASPKVNRDTGWSWRAFDRYWELSGDPRATELYRELIRANGPLIGKPPLVCQGQPADGRDGLTHIWTHAVTMATMHTGDPQLLDLLKTAAEGKERLGDYYCDLFAVLYHLTGEAKYKEAVLRKTNNGQSLLVAATGEHVYFPPASHWLLHQPPRSKAATSSKP
jgi:hypothetical protein